MITVLNSGAYVLNGTEIVTDEKEYVDTADLDVARMVAELSTYKGRSGTACPGVGDWLSAFEGYDEIYCVTIISTLSGSYNSALTAKQQYEEEHPGAKVFVLDSYSAGAEMKLHLEKIRDLVLEGLSFENICFTFGTNGCFDKTVAIIFNV